MYKCNFTHNAKNFIDTENSLIFMWHNDYCSWWAKSLFRIVTDMGKSKTHYYILNQQSFEKAIIIQQLMCSFGNDWLLAFILCSKTGNQPRATSGLFEDLVQVPHLLISQPSHLLNNYSVSFMLPQKQCAFFFFLPEAYAAF